MANVVVIGMQWGDEGKGKIVDLICPSFELVVRYQGGNNAGHTVKFGDRHFSLHLIPSGILHPGTRCVLGNGMVVAPEAFLAEIARLEAAGIDCEGRLFLSRQAHVLLPLHVAVDGLRERAAGAGGIGTTVRGIGPAYEAKAGRIGVRVADLYSDVLPSRLEEQLQRFGAEVARFQSDACAELSELLAQCASWGERLAPYVADTTAMLLRAVEEGRSILFEGAQGTLLDLDHGTYPFVTSSSPTAGGACVGSGVPPTAISGTIGILKAYSTRVGGGPMVTEEHGEAGEYLRQRGNEFGTTTGRPRRCGWLDLVAARYARRMNGIDAIALTKIDVLDQLGEIPVCVAYSIDGERLEEMPSDPRALERAEPVIETLPGWRQETVGVLRFDDLPVAARSYVQFVGERLGAPIAILSTGPRREETIVRELAVVSRLLPGLGTSPAG